MKTIFLLFACTFLISGLSALNFPLEEENFNAETFESAFENDNDDVLENFFLENENEQNFIAPGRRPTPPSTTTTERPSSTPRPRPTRPTRPTPTRPTTSPRPKPTTPTPPGLFRSGNAQIYENTVAGLGPFGSQLVNIVLNKEEGQQKTLQDNGILYNFKSLRENRNANDEETQE